MLGVALKEWAAVCEALASGRQIVLIRKGGIADAGGVFSPDHERFWLFPTYFHQQEEQLKPDAAPFWRNALVARTDDATVPLTHFAEVAEVLRVDDLERLSKIDDHHLWAPETVEKRFHYRTPGLFVMLLRVYEVEGAHRIENRPEYDGCKSWVELGAELPTESPVPVVADEPFAARMGEIKQRLQG